MLEGILRGRSCAHQEPEAKCTWRSHHRTLSAGGALAVLSLGLHDRLRYRPYVPPARFHSLAASFHADPSVELTSLPFLSRTKNPVSANVLLSELPATAWTHTGRGDLAPGLSDSLMMDKRSLRSQDNLSTWHPLRQWVHGATRGVCSKMVLGSSPISRT